VPNSVLEVCALVILAYETLTSWRETC